MVTLYQYSIIFAFQWLSHDNVLYINTSSNKVQMCVMTLDGSQEHDKWIWYNFVLNFHSGKTDFKPGWWIGVKYDEPLGKNNGRYIVHGNANNYLNCEMVNMCMWLII